MMKTKDQGHIGPKIQSVESFIISIPRDVPYLGPLGPGERINERGYLVRQGNRSIYPASDMSVLVKVTGESGMVGWGETYGIVAPGAVTSIIDDVLGPVILGRDPAARARRSRAAGSRLIDARTRAIAIDARRR